MTANEPGGGQGAPALHDPVNAILAAPAGVTPGPWIAIDTTTKNNRPVWHCEIRASSKDPILGSPAYRTVALMRSLEYQANDAHLIAAAPDLYAALEAISVDIDACIEGGEKPNPDDHADFTLSRGAVGAMHVALAKARGESPWQGEEATLSHSNARRDEEVA